MKLQIRDLKKNSFTLDVESSTQIPDVRKQVAEHHAAEPSQIRMIHSGKVLQDDKDIAFYNIKETDHIIAMVQKPKTKVAEAAPSTPAPSAPAVTPAAPAPAAVAPATQEPPATPTPAGSGAVPPSERRFDDTSPMMSQADRQNAIAGMESMGFERSEVERALRAAFWNADRAVEFLLNGIPENLQQEANAAPRTAVPQQQQPQAQQTNPTPAAPQPTAGAQDANEPVNLFEAAAAAQTRGGSGGTGAATGVTDAARGAGAAGQPAAGNLDFLRENPMFRQLRSIVQAQPGMLENVLQQVTAANPQLASMINQNPEQFLQLLTEGDDGDVEALPPGAREISVSEDERMAIERLCALGFERDLVIQAYFACDKNEELAANFLFDQPPDEDEGGDS